MTTTYATAKLTIVSGDLAAMSADVIVVTTAPAGGRRKGCVLVGPASSLKAVARRKLEESLSALGATGSTGELIRVPGAGISKAGIVLAVGLGAAGDGWSEESLRRAAGSATRALAGTRRVVLAFPAASPAELDAIAQGALLGAYAFAGYRSASLAGLKAPVERVSVLVPDAKDPASRAAASRAEIIATAVNLARDLVNTPAGHLPPAALATAAVDALADLPVDVKVWDEKALQAGGFGGILGVGQGSVNPPRLARMTYRPEGARVHLALVGKGITFDTGGISIKPSLSMHEMKSDMGGAAAVIAVVAAIARLGLPINLTGYICVAENMPSGTAQRPGDVLTNYGGRTVEVTDTDAEGRLVLGDGLVLAQEDKPDVLIDVATLTGAQVIALGSRTCGIMANDDDLREAVYDASVRAGEVMWPMPIPEELRANYDSIVADLVNIPLTGRRDGGMLGAAAFLREYIAPGQRWAHVDIAGPAYNSYGPRDYTPKGGTGVAVRTFVQLAEDLIDEAV